MRRRLIAIAALAALALGLSVLTGSAGSAQSDEGKGQETATVEIVKVVDGDGPTGGYVIEYSCVEDDVDDAPGEGGGAGFGGALNFDAAGPGTPETQTVVLTGPATCTVTETDSNGAVTVTYDCTFVPGEGPVGSPDGAFGEGLQQGGCLDSQTAQITAPNDVATITVTNTFEADVIDEEEEPPPDVDDDVVDATPPFTG